MKQLLLSFDATGALPWPYLLGGVFLVVVLLIVLENVLRKKRKTKKEREEEAKKFVAPEPPVRYATGAPVQSDGSVNATFLPDDVVLSKNVTYTAGKDFKPGKYTLLSVTDLDAFNLRLNGFVGEYKHNSDVILAPGDTICAVSHTVILR
mgnify:CR=1 FL=1